MVIKVSRSDSNKDKKDTDYVQNVNNRHSEILAMNLTIGQYFNKELVNDPYYRVKEKIFPRKAYIEEFDTICTKQKEFHPSLTNELIKEIRDKIIYYQRPLKSQKGLVSICEFEGFKKKGEGEEIFFVGPKVAPKTSPLSQLAKVWESINNIALKTPKGDPIIITQEQKITIFEYLDINEKLSFSELLKILNLKKKDCSSDKNLKGWSGNITKHLIRKQLNEKYPQLLKMDLKIISKDKESYLYDQKTRRILQTKVLKEIYPEVESESFYQLWHTIYSIKDQEECSSALQKRFEIDEETADNLAKIDFNRHGFSNKSAKVIRKILPYLMEGDKYSSAMSYAGYDHSNMNIQESFA